MILLMESDVLARACQVLSIAISEYSFHFSMAILEYLTASFEYLRASPDIIFAFSLRFFQSIKKIIII